MYEILRVLKMKREEAQKRAVELVDRMSLSSISLTNPLQNVSSLMVTGTKIRASHFKMRQFGSDIRCGKPKTESWSLR